MQQQQQQVQHQQAGAGSTGPAAPGLRQQPDASHQQHQAADVMQQLVQHTAKDHFCPPWSAIQDMEIPDDAPRASELQTILGAAKASVQETTTKLTQPQLKVQDRQDIVRQGIAGAKSRLEFTAVLAMRWICSWALLVAVESVMVLPPSTATDVSRSVCDRRRADKKAQNKQRFGFETSKQLWEKYVKQRLATGLTWDTVRERMRACCFYVWMFHQRPAKQWLWPSPFYACELWKVLTTDAKVSALRQGCSVRGQQAIPIWSWLFMYGHAPVCPAPVS